MKKTEKTKNTVVRAKKREPFIGITCDVHIPKGRTRVYYELICDHSYPEAVKHAGGYPILLPISRRPDVVHRYLKEIDGLVIVGGDDVDPTLYGEKKKRGTGTVFSPRMEFEIKLYRDARRRRMPILGICYGMQLINVLEGGTLFQDIRRDASSTLNHRNRRNPYHRIRIDASSRLARIIGKNPVQVHSDHHQAVCRVAPNFKAVAFAPDGMVEAIESDSERIYAVQWHPERNLRHDVTRRLFRSFVRLCAKK